jgi:hypothetical protein
MIRFIPYFSEENQDLIAYDIFINDAETQVGHIEMRDGQVVLVTNDHDRWFDVLTIEDLKEIINYMENNAVFSETIEKED